MSGKSDEILKLLKGMSYNEIRQTLDEVIKSVKNNSTYP